ncbi:SH3 domain-containing protein [Azospirillum sp. RWY-5-1]|uniref:SH3 domain-containing protein n=1 Tax=Azospirillum oleiclasticum TaxID=2735135 RepID=A0ABX2TGU4_9PROT|nr:SH3 domain-containing protein [Azospirillum oleiclasticum]NYZ15960.1 SH3 domain-containing protein [Azospirillum oleiclasticum]NYZ23561.1 SH3 domain-containing protein [Azospirillum oleiclasticum]
MAPVLRSLLLFLVAVLALAGPHPAQAQSPVATGAPLTGEVVLNRDVEVRVGPSEDARIVMTLSKGKPLNALGTPRGTNWTQVAIGGQPIGYVPWTALDPVYIPRFPNYGAPSAAGPAPGAAAAVAAVVPRAEWEAAAAGAPPQNGYVVATRNIGVTEFVDAKKRRTVTLRRGQVIKLGEVQNGRVDLLLPGRERVVAGFDGLLGVAGAYPVPGLPPVGTAPLFAAKLGEFVSYEEALRAWQAFVAGPGAQWRDRPPVVWPVFRSGHAFFQMGAGPFQGVELDRVCTTLAQRGLDCTPVELQTF